MKSISRSSSKIWLGVGLSIVMCSTMLPGLTGCNGSRDDGLPVTETNPASDSPTNPDSNSTGEPHAGASSTASTSFDPADLGMPIYPQARYARELSGAGGSARNRDGIVTAVYETSDSADQVIEFYEKALAQVNLQGRVIAPDRTEHTQDGRQVVMLSAPQEGKGSLRTVNVREDDGRTYIEMMNLQPLKSGRPLFRPPSSSTPPDQSAPAPAAPAGGVQVP